MNPPVTTFPIERIRAAFPALATRDTRRAPIFFDNPAGTRVPELIAKAAAACLTDTNANLGGHFATSVAAGEIVDAAHEAMADFLGAASPREIVIGPSMTSLTFAFSRSVAHLIQPGDEIVVTRMDHDGNVAPWLAIAQERGAIIRWLPFDRASYRVEPAALDEVLSSKTRLVALNYASNITGAVNDVATLANSARRAGALVYVDAVQYAPHGLIDVQSLNCDFLACSAYKFYGPHLGIVWAREDVLERLTPYKVRPSTMELPFRFETGTPQIEQQAALRATIEYLAWIGSHASTSVERREQIRAAFEATSAWESTLAQPLIDGLNSFAGLTLHGPGDARNPLTRVPTVSFTHRDHSSDSIARALAERDICVWSGNNYALETVRSLGVDEDDGVVRIGLAHYNTRDEIDATLEALEGILQR